MLTTLIERFAARGFRLMLAACVALPGAAAASESDTLAVRQAAWQLSTASEALGPRVAVASREGPVMSGDIDGALPAAFPLLAAHLVSPRDWCEIALLHLNIKTCTHERDAAGAALTFYSGSKRYEAPDRAYALRYSFRVDHASADYVSVTLSAASGPLDTSDYAIVVEAMPMGERSFVHLRYSYRPSFASRLATNGYLATVGSRKTGFTVVGQDRDGRPEYVSGMRGIVERNAVRNFLAIQAFLESCGAPPAQRVARSLERWFDLAERYPAQLHELDRADYLAAKAREYRQQLARQEAIDSLVVSAR